MCFINFDAFDLCLYTIDIYGTHEVLYLSIFLSSTEAHFQNTYGLHSLTWSLKSHCSEKHEQKYLSIDRQFCVSKGKVKPQL